jgi:hypothetical protein
MGAQSGFVVIDHVLEAMTPFPMQEREKDTRPLIPETSNATISLVNFMPGASPVNQPSRDITKYIMVRQQGSFTSAVYRYASDPSYVTSGHAFRRMKCLFLDAIYH